MEQVNRIIGGGFWQRHFQIFHVDFQSGPPHLLNFDDGCHLFYARLLPYAPAGFRYEIDFAISDIVELPEIFEESVGDVVLNLPTTGIVRRIAFDHPFYISEVHDDIGIKSPNYVPPGA